MHQGSQDAWSGAYSSPPPGAAQAAGADPQEVAISLPTSQASSVSEVDPRAAGRDDRTARRSSSSSSLSFNPAGVRSRRDNGRLPLFHIDGGKSQQQQSQNQSQNQNQRSALAVLTSWETVSATLCVLGLTGSLMAYGVLQERIMTIPFGASGSRFRHSLFLVFCNRVVACALALALTLASRGRVEPVAPLTSYAAVSVANVVSSTCQYEALKYVTFPVQVLAKCVKMIPVMAWQTVINREVYSLREYLHALLIIAGCATFLLEGEVASSVGLANTDSVGVLYLYGGVLLTVYLAVDGFTSTWQDHLFSGYNMDLCNQVLYTTTVSVVLSAVGMVVTGKLWPALEFMRKHPEAWAWVFGISLASATVQFFISHTIKSYGALIFATIMTTRQWFSILLSSLVFAHPLTLGQWLGTVVVFGTLYHKFYYKAQS